MNSARTLKALEKRLATVKWRPMPADLAEASLKAALTERRRQLQTTSRATAVVDRLYLFVWRFKWAFATLVAIGAIGGAVGYESREGTSRLAQVRQKLIEHGGSPNPMDLVPPTVPREQNFFAIDAIQDCRLERDNPKVARYNLSELAWNPAHHLAFASDNAGQLTVDKWFSLMANRVAAHEALRKAVQQPGGRMDQILAAVDRPFAQIIPSSRERFAASANSFSGLENPHIDYGVSTMNSIAHYGSLAARVGETERAARAFAAVLRFAEACGNDVLGLDGVTDGLACEGMVTWQLSQALGSNEWSEAAVTLLQAELFRQDSLNFTKRGILFSSALGMTRIEDPLPAAQDALHASSGSDWRVRYVTLVSALSPQGVRDANAALYGEAMLDVMGPGTTAGWIEARQGKAWSVITDSTGRDGDNWTAWLWNNGNPSRVIATSIFPVMPNLMRQAAGQTFRRRAAAVACAVLRHRLAHGSDPASLDALVPDFLPARVEDPALPGQWLKVQMDGKNLRLWSVGPDRTDDGGDTAKDWVWELGAPLRISGR